MKSLKNLEHITVSEFMNASKEEQDDFDIALKAISFNGDSFRYVSDRLKSNKELCLKSIEDKINNFQYASKELKDDKDFILKIVDKHPYVITYMSPRLMVDEEIAIRCLSKINLLSEFSYEIIDNKKIVLQAIKNNHYAFQDISNRLKSDEKFCLEALRANGKIFDFIDDKLKKGPKIMLEAIKYDYTNISKLDENKKYDKELYLEIFKNRNYIQKEKINFNMFKCMPKEYLNDDMVLYIAQNNFKISTEIRNKILTEKKYFNKIIKKSPQFFKEIENQTPSICLELVKIDEKFIDYIQDKNLKKDLLESLIDDTLNEFEKLYPQYF